MPPFKNQPDDVQSVESYNSDDTVTQYQKGNSRKQHEDLKTLADQSGLTKDVWKKMIANYKLLAQVNPGKARKIAKINVTTPEDQIQPTLEDYEMTE